MTVRTFILALSIVTFISPIACGQPAPPRAALAGRSGQIEYPRRAEIFVSAINAGDAQTAIKAIGLPLMYRNQEWKDAEGGGGYVLGAARDQIFTDETSATSFVNKLLQTVRLESTKVEIDGPSISEMLTEYLAGAPGGWHDLALFYFVRGTGDVEHTVLIGVDPASGQVRGIYTN